MNDRGLTVDNPIRCPGARTVRQREPLPKEPLETSQRWADRFARTRWYGSLPPFNISPRLGRKVMRSPRNLRI